LWSPLTEDGWGNNFRSESIPDSLPKLGHNPQHPPFNLYTEGMTGTAFTAPRAKNRRSWFYRIRPSVIHYPFEPYTGNVLPEPEVVTPQQLRWDPFEVPNSAELDFVDGLRTICGAGSAQSKDGLAIHHYEFGRNMERKAMYSSDGDFLFVPVKGTLLITTEFGKMDVPQHHIAVVQRSMKFSVSADGPASGYLLEIYKGHFELPELGPIGGNGLANLEDFETPVAAYEDADEEWLVVNKYGGRLFQYKQDHSPYDVVAWMGNYGGY
jgi:homogentisate 1,2-dioxygenase